MYEGRFIGGLPFAEALQHPLKAVHRLLRRCDLHLPAGGEYPAVEIAAEINGRLHSEVVLVHNLRGSILPEAVDDAVHEGAFAQQSDTAGLAVEHGKLLREELRYVKALWLFYSGFIRNLHLNDTVNAELCDLLPVIVETDEIVCIVIPKHGEWGDGVDSSAMPENPLLGRSVVEIAEGDFLPLRDSSLDSVYIQKYALVGGFGTAVDVDLPFQKGCISGCHEGRKPFNQRLALSGSDEPRRLHRVDEELNLRGFKVPGCHMVEVLHSAFFDDIHAELHKLFNVVAERARVGGDAVFLQMGGDIGKRNRMGFIRGLPEVFEQDERAICECHGSSVLHMHHRSDRCPFHQQIRLNSN